MENSTRISIFFVYLFLLCISKSDSLESVSIFPGVKIVESNVDNKGFSDRMSNGDLFQRAFEFLKTHELKLEWSSFVNGSDIEKMYRNISDLYQSEDINSTEARKSGKGGSGYIMLMGAMLAKTMGALGFGGVALLALKALGASLAALLLSSIVGLKKLGEQGHHESHVQYVTADHHRKKRNIQ